LSLYDLARFVSCLLTHRHLHSFPTRRSSDLARLMTKLPPKTGIPKKASIPPVTHFNTLAGDKSLTSESFFYMQNISIVYHSFSLLSTSFIYFSIYFKFCIY